MCIRDRYEAAGALIADTNTVWEKADLYYKVKELFPQEFKWMNKDKILFTYIPVSYTHLDVYKRQPAAETAGTPVPPPGRSGRPTPPAWGGSSPRR